MDTERYGTNDFETAEEFLRYVNGRMAHLGFKYMTNVENLGGGFKNIYAFSVLTTYGTYGHPAYSMQWTNLY